MKHKIKTVRLSSGLILEYAERGEEAGVPVIFLHGYTDSWRSFEPLLAHLTASPRANAVSQRGHGDSDRPQSGYLWGDADRICGRREQDALIAAIMGSRLTIYPGGGHGMH